MSFRIKLAFLGVYSGWGAIYSAISKYLGFACVNTGLQGVGVTLFSPFLVVCPDFTFPLIFKTSPMFVRYVERNFGFRPPGWRKFHLDVTKNIM